MSDEKQYEDLEAKVWFLEHLLRQARNDFSRYIQGLETVNRKQVVRDLDERAEAYYKTLAALNERLEGKE